MNTDYIRLFKTFYKILSVFEYQLKEKLNTTLEQWCMIKCGHEDWISEFREIYYYDSDFIDLYSNITTIIHSYNNKKCASLDKIVFLFSYLEINTIKRANNREYQKTVIKSKYLSDFVSEKTRLLDCIFEYAIASDYLHNDSKIDIAKVHKELSDIKNFRNDIFHFNYLYDKSVIPNVKGKFDLIYKYIRIMNNTIPKSYFQDDIDNFNEIYPTL